MFHARLCSYFISIDVCLCHISIVICLCFNLIPLYTVSFEFTSIGLGRHPTTKISKASFSKQTQSYKNNNIAFTFKRKQQKTITHISYSRLFPIFSKHIYCLTKWQIDLDNISFTFHPSKPYFMTQVPCPSPCCHRLYPYYRVNVSTSTFL